MKNIIAITLAVFSIVWIYLLFSFFLSPNISVEVNHAEKVAIVNTNEKAMVVQSVTLEAIEHMQNKKFHDIKKESIIIPKFYKEEINILEPPTVAEVARNLTIYLQTLHGRLKAISGPTITAQAVWDTFLEVTSTLPMTWDDMNKNRYHKQRKDKSIFVGLVTYRDPFCPMTIKSLFDKARRPEKLSIVLFQQNCFEKVCRTGVLKGGIVENAKTDVDCYKDFCASAIGIRSNACHTGQIRLFNVNESESLGPYMARYMAVKFYQGEQYYLQIDSHSEFVDNWDDKLIKMVDDAPALKPVISCYPPGQNDAWKDSIGYRICDSEYAQSSIESQIIRLGSGLQFDRQLQAVPVYAPFVAAGFFFGPAELLREVPFDPLLPWIFMGEEISMSARLWTSGYDIFSPTINVLNHYYVRRHYPKFWESVNRFFKRPIHNDVAELVLTRCKNLLDYPESHNQYVNPRSMLYRLEEWGMGDKRSYNQYLQMVGLNMKSKKVRQNTWCHRGEWPEEAKPYYVDKKRDFKN